MRAAGHRTVPDQNNNDLKKEDSSHNEDEEGTLCDATEDINFILDLPGVDKVKDLQEHE